MQPTYERQSKTKLVASILAVIVIAGVILIADHLKAKSTSGVNASLASSTTTQPAPTTTSTTSTNATGTATGATPSSGTATTGTSASTSGFKDGTYTASSEYYVPHSYEAIKVSLTLKDGVITSSSIANSEGDPTSAYFQQNFAATYKSYVVGKKISSIQLSRISGASDTSRGFNDAVSQIVSKAKARIVSDSIERAAL